MTDMPSNSYWLQLASGMPFNITGDLDISPITIADLSAHLAKINRFTGGTRVPYSVAQHSVHVSKLVKRYGGSLDEQIAGLLHDAHEIVFSDMPSPLKWALNSPDLKRIERDVQNRIEVGLSVTTGVSIAPAYTEKVNTADLAALATEKRDLLGECPIDWSIELPKADHVRIKPVGWRAAQRMFIERFDWLLQKAEKRLP